MGGNELMEKMQPKNIFELNLFGVNVGISDSIIVMWLVMAVIIVLAYIFTRNLKTIPAGKQNIAEVIVEFVNNFAKSNIGHHWKPFAPYLGTILLFLVFSNIVSIFNIIPTAEDLYHFTGWKVFEHMHSLEIAPPTKDINVTAAMAIMSIIVVLYAGIRIKRVKNWIKSFFEPMFFMFPFKVLDYFVRPLSLCFRLFGNIIAAFTIMELLMGVVSVAIPAVFSIYFDLFDGILQAYIFVFLTSLYIMEAIE